MPKKSIKRENGTGSVYHRKDLKRRPWIALAPAVKKNGKYQRIIIGNYATAQEAKDALYQYNKSPTEKYNITVAEAFDEWSRIAYRKISAATQANYDAAYKKMKPVHDLKLRDLRTAQMQAIIDDNADMSRSSLSKIKLLFSQLLDYGMENDVLLKNYAQFIVLPKEEKKQKDCFTDIELKKIEDAVGKVPYADLILIMCYTGFRISEFLELTPFSCDAEKGTLTGGRKTEAGKNRIIPIHPKIRSHVAQWLNKGGQTIFCREDGKPFDVKRFRENCYYPALEKIGVRKLTPHATRHTFATRLSAAGVKPEDVQKLMGHSNFEITANVYIHQNLETLEKAVNQIK
jgi:integrase